MAQPESFFDKFKALKSGELNIFGFDLSESFKDLGGMFKSFFSKAASWISENTSLSLDKATKVMTKLKDKAGAMIGRKVEEAAEEAKQGFTKFANENGKGISGLIEDIKDIVNDPDSNLSQTPVRENFAAADKNPAAPLDNKPDNTPSADPTPLDPPTAGQ